MPRKTESFVAPSAWASAIVNLDYSGLDPEDHGALNTFLVRERLSFRDCLTCEPIGFCRQHDAWPEMPLAADCHRYTFPA